MSKHPRNRPSWVRAALRPRVIAVALAFIFQGGASMSVAEPVEEETLHVAVYDVAPYGSVGPDGLFVGASVDLWRRAAEDLHRPYRFTLVAQMDAILNGVERGQFDAAIGAITITAERLTRVDFSYPAHRSGVAVALRRETGPSAALMAYASIVEDLGSLILIILALLLAIGVLMWAFERPGRNAAPSADSSVTSLIEGIYWAVVTMTTVGYGDKTPKTPVGRFLAVLWMLGSLALISLLSTSLVSRMTADRLTSGPTVRDTDLLGKRLAAVEYSSGAEYLESQHLPYTKYPTLQSALAALANNEADAVVNSIGALQYLISKRFSAVIAMPGNLLAPAYMAFALPPNSPLRKPLDRALVRVTASAGWRSQEESYFGR